MLGTNVRIDRPGMESRQTKRRLGQGERISRVTVVREFVAAFHAALHPEIDAAQNDDGFRRDAHEDLHGRLPVDLGGDIHNLAAFDEAVRRRVGPSSGQVEPHGTARPDDLVLECGAAGLAHKMTHGLEDLPL